MNNTSCILGSIRNYTVTSIQKLRHPILPHFLFKRLTRIRIFYLYIDDIPQLVNVLSETKKDACHGLKFDSRKK